MTSRDINNCHCLAPIAQPSPACVLILCLKDQRKVIYHTFLVDPGLNIAVYLFKMSMTGWDKCQTQFFFRAEMIPRKHHFWSFLAITIAVCQMQMILTIIPSQNDHDGMGICAKHINFIQCRNDS